MPSPGEKQPLESRLRDAAGHAEDEVKRLVAYINDEVVPDVRRNGSKGLRFAADELRRLAERIEDSARRPPSPPAKP